MFLDILLGIIFLIGILLNIKISYHVSRFHFRQHILGTTCFFKYHFWPPNIRYHKYLLCTFLHILLTPLILYNLPASSSSSCTLKFVIIITKDRCSMCHLNLFQDNHHHIFNFFCSSKIIHFDKIRFIVIFHHISFTLPLSQ